MIQIAGINFETAEISALEKIYVKKENIVDLLQTIKKRYGISDMVLLSTCNRVEFVTSNLDVDIKKIFEENIIKDSINKLPANAVYINTGLDAVKHIFSVTSGLNSAIIGETQITNQVKQYYELALSNNLTSKVLNKLFQKSFNVAKLVRFKTSISARSTSLSNIALKLTYRVFPYIKDLTITVFGSGEIGKDVIDIFTKEAPKVVNIVTNRKDFNPNPELTRYIDPQQKKQIIRDSDLIITATFSNGWLISHKDLLAHKSPLLILDLSIPRVVDPECLNIDDIYLYNINDLGSIARENIEKRKDELQFAYKIISDEAQTFLNTINR